MLEVVLGMVKSILSKITPKAWFYGTLVLFLALALGFLYAQWYRAVYAKGVASQTALVAKANAETTKAKQDLVAYQGTYAQWVQTTKNAQQALAQANSDKVSQLNDEITALNQKLSKAQKDLSHVTSAFVSAQADATCHLPSGFVLLYNQSIDPPTTGSGAVFTSPSRELADAPSGLSCSTVAELIAQNNLLAVQYRQAVLSWQAWYKANQEAIQRFEKTQSQSAPH